jgi:hypothetical protein
METIIENLQTITDIYRSFLKIGPVRIRIGTAENLRGADARAYRHRRKMYPRNLNSWKMVSVPRGIVVHKKFLNTSRRAQIEIILHELMHFKYPRSHHNKIFKHALGAWFTDNKYTSD